MTKPSLNPNLRDFWRVPARNRVLYGGRSSSKSWDAAGFAIFLASNYKVKFLCTRHFQNRIADSVYSLLKIQIDRFGLGGMFRVLESSIECPSTGSEFIFYGRARNIDEIKGTEGVDVHWAEECEKMTREQWRVIDPTLRGDHSQHWLIFNPKFATDFVYQRFVVSPPPRTIVRQINYDENPFLTDNMRSVIEATQAEDLDEYNHVYLGHPLSDSDRVVIKRRWIEAAIDAHIKLGFEATGRKRIGFDVADSGDDKCAMVTAIGPVIVAADEWKGLEDELLQSCMKVYRAASFEGADVTYDCIGVGATVGSKFNELNANPANYKHRVRHTGFNAAGAVMNPQSMYAHGRTNAEMFLNVKAQVWRLVADRFKNTYDAVVHGRQFKPDEMISISSNLANREKLIAELSAPLLEYNADGLEKIESKKDMAKRGVPSPNIADALIMCFAGAGQFNLSSLL